jgi:hypothetical protein
VGGVAPASQVVGVRADGGGIAARLRQPEAGLTPQREVRRAGQDNQPKMTITRSRLSTL